MSSIVQRLDLTKGIDLVKTNNFTRSSFDNRNDWNSAFDFLARMVAYIAMLALIALIILMILKYISGNLNNDEEERATETNPLITPGKTVDYTYGTRETDLETGNCSSSNNSFEECYDEKLCAICYDEVRNCFFVPCGHCATCYDCARRIFTGDSKVCPVCRRLIGKVRKLFAA